MEQRELKNFEGSKIIFWCFDKSDAYNGRMTSDIAKELHSKKYIPKTALVLTENLPDSDMVQATILWADEELSAPPAVAMGTMKRYSFHRWPNGVILQEAM